MNDKSAYKALTAKVAKIDKDAARYMREQAPALKDFVYDGELVCCFTWDYTPQGHNFWEDINDKLNNEDT